MNLQRIYFVHGRPAGHPIHARYGHSIDAKFRFEDPWIRWHDKSYPAPIRHFAWIVNCFAFIKFRKTVIVTEGLRLTVVLSKVLSFGRVTLIALVADESPYFIYSGFYSKISRYVNTWAYRKYDACICIGKMEADLVSSIVKPKTLLATGFNGIAQEKIIKLDSLKYNVSSKRILFIGNGPADWRSWYKGLDLMLTVFSDLIELGHDLTFDIAGDWNIDTLCLGLSVDKRKRINFVGKIKDVSELLKDAALYLHTARGDAWGLVINEAMAAGVIPIISEWTGAKEMVEQVSKDLIVELERKVIVNRVNWFLGLEDVYKLNLSNCCKKVSAAYTEDRAVEKFEENFQLICSQLNCH